MNLAIHLANSALVWLLARRLSMGRFPATVAALVFALHGTRPEVVSWAAARFDLLAAFFALAALLAIDRFPLMAFFTVLALLSKEAAYGLPFLVLLLIPMSPRGERVRILKAATGVAAVCALVFVWRSWFLGGIGGYTTQTGAPSIFQFSAVRSAKALFYRQWAILLFPINWSRAPGLLLQFATVAMVAVAAGFLRYSHGPRRLLATSLGFVVLAALPAQHLLLIGTDLNGARVLYLPAVGLARSGASLSTAVRSGLPAMRFPPVCSCSRSRRSSSTISRSGATSRSFRSEPAVRSAWKWPEIRGLWL